MRFLHSIKWDNSLQIAIHPLFIQKQPLIAARTYKCNQYYGETVLFIFPEWMKKVLFHGTIVLLSDNPDIWMNVNTQRQLQEMPRDHRNTNNDNFP